MESLYFRSVDCDYIFSDISFLAGKIEELATVYDSISDNGANHSAYKINLRLA